MHRFFIGEMRLRGLLAGTTLSVQESLAHQIRDVLRLKVGEQMVLFDNSGDEQLASVLSLHKTDVTVLLGERRPGKKEPAARIILCQGLMKSARFEWILEKGTEIGVTTFLPLLCRRSTAGLEAAGSAKIQRWRRIVQEAAEQSGRARIPDFAPISSLSVLLASIPADALAIMPWEEERASGLYHVLHQEEFRAVRASHASQDIYLLIGPEGGLTSEEVALARSHAVKIVSLGSRILRAETAALAALACLIYELEPA